MQDLLAELCLSEEARDCCLVAAQFLPKYLERNRFACCGFGAVNDCGSSFADELTERVASDRLP